MIEYTRGLYSLNLLLYQHGSTLYSGFFPGFLALVVFYLFKFHNIDNTSATGEPKLSLLAASVIATYVISVSFVLVYRVKFCNDRYWEACDTVHLMMSKWLDATVHTTCFHMQNPHLRKKRPPSLYLHADFLNEHASVDRERIQTAGLKKPGLNLCPPPIMKEEEGEGGGGGGEIQDGLREDDQPTLFLQELAHLSSLLLAVSFNSLRADINGSYSDASYCLGEYQLDKPWPVADPFDIEYEKRKNFLFGWKMWNNLQYLLGLAHSPALQRKYMEGRPLLVLGGVSVNEVIALRRARGPSAKVTLVWFWLSEFITRESLAGSLGQVHPGIISRIHQFYSDGMKFYNHARKISYISFPFPFDQLCNFIILPLIIFIPLMISEYSKSFWIGALLSFLSIHCLYGQLEVARELEVPFHNYPNEIPFCSLLAMYNESLMSMCSGFHPDHYWKTRNRVGFGNSSSKN